ncbi:hypothetical protein D1872_293340 [compost metagenome]
MAQNNGTTAQFFTYIRLQDNRFSRAFLHREVKSIRLIHTFQGDLRRQFELVREGILLSAKPGGVGHLKDSLIRRISLNLPKGRSFAHRAAPQFINVFSVNEDPDIFDCALLPKRILGLFVKFGVGDTAD